MALFEPETGRRISRFGAALGGNLGQFDQNIAAQDQRLDEQRSNALLKDSFTIQQHLINNDIPAARGALLSRLEAGGRAGGDMRDTQGLLDKIDAGDFSGALNDVSTVVDFAVRTGRLEAPAGAADKSAGTREFEALVKAGNLSEEEIIEAAKVNLGLSGRASNRLSAVEQAEVALKVAQAKAGVKVKTERSLNAILADRKKGVTLAGDEATRLSGFISEGIAALDSLPKLERGLELLKSVKTGGIAAKSKAVSDFFGTTSGDIGELNNILAQKVLDGLSAFTGAISEGERAFIEKMETGLRSGTAVNVRLLNQGKRLLERKITRARSAAVVAEDDFSLDLFDNPNRLSLSPQSGKQDQSQQRNVTVDF